MREEIIYGIAQYHLFRCLWDSKMSILKPCQLITGLIPVPLTPGTKYYLLTEDLQDFLVLRTGIYSTIIKELMQMAGMITGREVHLIRKLSLKILLLFCIPDSSLTENYIIIKK